jgi:predicted transcriptional regulator
MKKVLEDILRRVEGWPEAAQDEAAASLQSIEQELLEPYELSEEDKKAIDRGLADLGGGRLVPDEKVTEFFQRHRR